MELTVIISYYKALKNLKLILAALNVQSNKNFEVIISEDDFNDETIQFVARNSQEYRFPITHLYQKEDNGFRKNEMLNKSILAAKTDRLVFIDGDCIPHKHFVKNYLKHMREGFIFEGRSVMLGEKFSKKLVTSLAIKKLNLGSIIFSDSSKIKEGIYSPAFGLSYKKGGRGLLGRNWGICKKHLLAVNGFDMDYVFAGVGEDVDIEWRLKAMGIKTISMKNKAIVYHIYHPKTYSEEKVKSNYDLLHQKQKANHIQCLNGIIQVNP